MKVKSLYMPNTCLQEDKFPAHVIWDNTKNVEITLKIPESLQILEIFNVPDSAIERREDNSVILKDFEINGYLGLVFKSIIFDDPRRQESIEFEIKDLETLKIKKYIRSVELFRPLLRVQTPPSKISIIKNPKTGAFEPDQKIKLENIGDGTAVIAIDLITEDNFIKTQPQGMENFVHKFFEDFKEMATVIKEDYPEYAKIIDEFLELQGKPISLDDATINKVRDVFERLSNSLQENKNFQADFEKAIVISYVDNLQLITEITSFMEYLNSIGKGRIVLLNSVDVIKPKTESGTLNLKIQMTDLAYHTFPSIDIEGIVLKNAGKWEVPIHSLFDWNGD